MAPKIASTKIFMATRGQIDRNQNCFVKSGRNVVLSMEISPGKCSSYYATQGESYSPSSSELTDHFNLLKTVISHFSISFITADTMDTKTTCILFGSIKC